MYLICLINGKQVKFSAGIKVYSEYWNGEKMGMLQQERAGIFPGSRYYQKNVSKENFTSVCEKKDELVVIIKLF